MHILNADLLICDSYDSDIQHYSLMSNWLRAASERNTGSQEFLNEIIRQNAVEEITQAVDNDCLVIGYRSLQRGVAIQTA